MKTLGITGGIASGKSTIAGFFEVLGIPVYKADDRAKQIMVSDPELILRIQREFGTEAYLRGELNRSFLAQAIFSDSSKREVLNGLVHPSVARDFERFKEENTTSSYVVYEAALILENKTQKHFDKVLVVHVPEEVRRARVLKRDTFRTESEVNGILKAQLSDEERLETEGIRIMNAMDEKLLIPELLALDQEMRGGG